MPFVRQPRRFACTQLVATKKGARVCEHNVGACSRTDARALYWCAAGDPKSAGRPTDAHPRPSPSLPTARKSIKVTFVKPDGSRQEVSAPIGDSMLEVAHANKIDIEGAFSRG